MKTHSGRIIYGMMFLSLFIEVAPAMAHCDTMNGPVITAAENALNKGNVKLVLIWVQSKDEAFVTELFNRTLEIRKNHPGVRELADRNFFENLVRIHRAGEGESYTGIKDVNETEPPVEAADMALESGSPDDVVKMLNSALYKEIHEKFNTMMALKNFDKDNVGAGREFVESYITFLHYIEGIYNTVYAKDNHHKISDSNEDTETNNAGISDLNVLSNNIPNNRITHILIIGFALLIIALQMFTLLKRSH